MQFTFLIHFFLIISVILILQLLLMTAEIKEKRSDTLINVQKFLRILFYAYIVLLPRNYFRHAISHF